MIMLLKNHAFVNALSKCGRKNERGNMLRVRSFARSGDRKKPLNAQTAALSSKAKNMPGLPPAPATDYGAPC